MFLLQGWEWRNIRRRRRAGALKAPQYLLRVLKMSSAHHCAQRSMSALGCQRCVKIILFTGIYRSSQLHTHFHLLQFQPCFPFRASSFSLPFAGKFMCLFLSVPCPSMYSWTRETQIPVTALCQSCQHKSTHRSSQPRACSRTCPPTSLLSSSTWLPCDRFAALVYDQCLLFCNHPSC